MQPMTTRPEGTGDAMEGDGRRRAGTSQASAGQAGADQAPAALRRDVRLLGNALGRVLVESGGPELLADVERLRLAAIGLRAGADEPEERPARVQAVLDIVESLELGRAAEVARAFTVYFQLVNLAEERHRVRTLRERSRLGGKVKDSIEVGVDTLRERGGDEALEEVLARLEVAPVLTAHPTEARRRAVVDALGRIAAQVERLDDPRLSPAEEREVGRRLLEEISILWRTAQLREARPTPLDEVRTVMAVFDETLFLVVPLLYRELEAALRDTAPAKGAAPVPGEDAGVLPARVPAFLRLGSWVGGDRDGNPSVTHETTAAALEIQADHVLMGLERAARRIGRSLTATDVTTPASAELLASLGEDERAFPRAGRELRQRTPREPHRRKLLLVAERLATTRSGSGGGYLHPGEFLADLRLVQTSLATAGAQRLAYGELQHLVWQAETFGFHLASLEVRQHSSVHDEVLKELAPEAVGDAAALDRLVREGWPAATRPHSALAEEVLATLRTVAELQQRYGPSACRRYVVSQTRSAADVLAVLALARLAVPGFAPGGDGNGVGKGARARPRAGGSGGMALEVVPLFESRADLQAARRVLDELDALPSGRGITRPAVGRFEVMLGYSDSAKDVGFLAANLALYRAQEELAAWAAARGVDLVLFHGRGGALGRGGGPANRAVRGQAPGSVNGRFKVTEQGEVIFARYGNLDIAHRHLEQVTSAGLAASAPAPERAFRPPAEVLDRMATASEAAWKALVTAPGFADFFFQVSPLDELAELRIGSRPARRVAGATDIGSLRAIPWVFAWTQNRCNLPGWYGLGAGLAAVADQPGGLDTLRELHRSWPFFTSLMENAEMSLAKADRSIARLYLDQGGRPDLTAAIEAELDRTTRLVLAVTGSDRLLARRQVLRQAVALRNPYVDALSFLQLRFLAELRAGVDDPARRARVAELVLLTVNGVAAGLQNTG
jgi:phosphoenolpyruvate carboxylase